MESTLNQPKKLGMGDRLYVERPFQAGKSVCKVEDRLQVICGIETLENMRCATVKNTRTRTCLLMPVDNLKLFCKRVGFDGLEDFS